MPVAVMEQRRTARWTIALAAACLLLAACGADERSAVPPPLRVGIDLWPGFFPIAIAQQQGLLAQRGVEVEVHLASDTDALSGEFAAGNHDIIGVALGDAITLSRIQPDVVVLLVTDESTGGDVVMRRQGFVDDGRSPLRIGTNIGGFGELFLQTYVERAGLNPARMVWSDIDAWQVPQALRDGSLDFAHTWQPYTITALADGATTVFTSAETPGLIPSVYLTTRAVMETREAELRLMTEAWFEASAWWRNNPDSGNAIAAAALKLDPKSVSLQGVRPYTQADNRAAMTGGPAAPLAKLIDQYSTFFVERGSLSTPPQATRMLHPELFEPTAVKAE